MAASLPNLQPDVLTVYSYPCQGTPVQQEPLVLLHGWGCDSRIWQTLLPLLTAHVDVQLVDLPGFGDSGPLVNDGLDDYLEALATVLPERCSLLGWSLGGMLATAFASRYPQRVSHLLTIASNPAFVQRPGWVSAMPMETFGDFCELFRQQPELCLKRFQGLQGRGDVQERELVKQLRGVCGQPSTAQMTSWRRGLELLQELDNRQGLASFSVPSLHIFGAVDQLVPVDAASNLQTLNPALEVVVLEQTAHVPQLTCPQLIADKMMEFLQRDRYHLDKQRVADSFSRAATSYDSVARLQRQVGQNLLEQLGVGQPPQVVLDLGCGTGYFTVRLARRYDKAELTGIDLAQGMLDFARDQHGDCAAWLCGDAEALSLPDNSVDLIFSNLALQWCERLPQLARELARVLKPGGTLAFTSLGQQTLKELRQSWAAVDDYVHVNRFQAAELWHEAFAAAGFHFGRFEVEAEVLQYRDLRHLTTELKGLGAHNVNQGRNRGMTGREQVRRLVSAYDQFRNGDGQLPATWEVIYGVATLHG
ncbi:MAG: malonyl-ACP O-methyltransferase BioC [Porticoccaceae bacterium]